MADVETWKCGFVSATNEACPIPTEAAHYEPRWARAFPAHTPFADSAERRAVRKVESDLRAILLDVAASLRPGAQRQGRR